MATDVVPNGGPSLGILVADQGSYTWTVHTLTGVQTILVSTEDTVNPNDAVYVVELPGPRLVAVPPVVFATDMSAFQCQRGS